ncbi:MAG: hypothetical protein LUQ26_14620 [Methylococcaceae bacterium]|nr:hypothetical protein [Methylococcaceae bacterium]
MNSKLVSMLASLCIALILIIIGEWFYAVRVQKHAMTLTTSAETKIAHDEMPGIELTRQSEESYEDMVTRPLFIKGRRPVDEPSPEEAQAANVANTFDWQLNGVYTTKKGLSALFSRSTSKVRKDNYRKITAGADLDGWKLTEIQKDRAILKQGNQQKELLLRKPKLKELPKRSNVPNIPNSPQPEVSPPPEEGDFENSNNENF